MLRVVSIAGLGAWLMLAGVVAAPAQEARPGQAEAWAQARIEALGVREALAREVAAMTRLRAVQKELMAWNLERAEVGSAARTLRPEICREAELERWCRLFPATFGVWEERP